jgi:hypothetical protein
LITVVGVVDLRHLPIVARGARSVRPHLRLEEEPSMEAQIVLGILGAAGVASAFIYALKGLLDQIPGLIRSWRRVLDEARGDAPSPPAPDERRSSAGNAADAADG